MSPGYLKEIQENTNILKHIIFINVKILEAQNVDLFSKRRAPKNDEDPYKQILKILDMG